MNKTAIKDQISGGIVNEVNKRRIIDEINELELQDVAFADALKEINVVRNFVGKPENILGSNKTKHGEVAEQVEVGVGRAKDLLSRKTPSATFEGVGRTAPEDYIKNGELVQSKYTNGTNNNLKHILDHMEKYETFGRNGSYYEIPKNTYEQIEKIIRNQEVEGLKGSTKRAILEKVRLIEEESGKSFSEVVRPGVSSYDEIQLGKVEEILDGYENALKKDNEVKKDIIREEYKANLSEGLKVTGMAAAIGAGVSLTSSLYQKYKEGKKFYRGDLSIEEWKEIGITAGKDSVKAGITGGTIYGLTNYAGMSAPFAAAAVSATKGVASLVKDYEKGKITSNELMELGLIICGESAIVGVSSAIGQAIIPIPILGAVIGSIAGSMLNNILNFNKKTGTLIEKELKLALEKLDKRYQKIVYDIRKQYEELGNLLDAAFDVKNNRSLLESSLEVALAYGVEEEKIMKSIDDVENFMLM